MDQLALFKKAQEMAQKKKQLDEELRKMDFTGTGADGKVKGAFKFIPVSKYVGFPLAHFSAAQLTGSTRLPFPFIARCSHNRPLFSCTKHMKC
jgi:hypothetical protein